MPKPFHILFLILYSSKEENDDLTVLFAIYFEPYAALLSAAELHAILMEEIISSSPRYFMNLTIDSNSLEIREINRQRLEDLPGTTSSPLGVMDITTNEVSATPASPQYRCEPLKLHYCNSIGYNVTTYPNYLGHLTIDDVQADVIAFRELVDAECYRQAFDFVCRLLQPPCVDRQGNTQPIPQPLCREYCQQFAAGCGDRIPIRFRKFLDCEKFPESNGVQSCQNAPGCIDDLNERALSGRLCDGFADCADLSDEMTCKFCPPGSLYCGRGRVCIPKTARCDGKLDCPDGADEKDCCKFVVLTESGFRT